VFSNTELLTAAVRPDLVVGQSFRIIMSSVAIFLITTVSNHVRRYAKELHFFLVGGDAFVPRIVRTTRPV